MLTEQRKGQIIEIDDELFKLIILYHSKKVKNVSKAQKCHYNKKFDCSNRQAGPKKESIYASQ